jgi:hypothetical protein
MNEAMQEGLRSAAKRTASENPANLEGAVRAGTLAYRRRLLWAQAAAVLAVVLLAGGLVWAQSAAYGATTAQDRGTGARTHTTTGPATSSTTSTTTSPTTSPAAVLTAIRISPDPLTVPAGSQVQATATGVYSDDSNSPLGAGVTWSTDPPDSAIVNPQGLVQGRVPGTASLTATLNGVTGTASVLVGKPLPPPQEPAAPQSTPATPPASFGGGVKTSPPQPLPTTAPPKALLACQWTSVCLKRSTTKMSASPSPK